LVIEIERILAAYRRENFISMILRQRCL